MNREEKINICKKIIEHEIRMRDTLRNQVMTEYVKERMARIDVTVQALKMLKRKLERGEVK
jgi:hypothetical protein